MLYEMNNTSNIVVKKITYGMEITKYMVIQTSDKKEEEINESVKMGQMQRTHQYKYMGLVLNLIYTLEDYIVYINME